MDRRHLEYVVAVQHFVDFSADDQRSGTLGPESLTS